MLSAGIEGSAGGDPTEALAELRTLSLLQLDDESLRLHRLVLKCARATLPEHARADACAIALEWINSILPDTEYDETNWKLWNRLSPHLDEVIAAGNALKIESKVLGAICGELGVWLLYQARYNQAEPLMQRVVEIFEKSLGKDHPNVAAALNNLAALLQDTNRLEEAEPWMRRALAIDEKSYGPEHPNVARDLNNLALLLQATNRLGEAEPLSRRNVLIVLKFTRRTGHLHPHLKDAFGNYWSILEGVSLSEEEIARRIAEVGREAGLDEQSHHALVAELSK
jgi:tetratricopeptide (TPR) repeat protein